MNLSKRILSHHLIGGTLLVAGTSIGVGMLALPVVTSMGGFIPSIAVYLVCWFYMILTGLLILEACLWCPNDSNLITITRTLLGPKGAAVCWFTYLFLFYCLMVAHTAIGGSAAQGVIPSLPGWLASTIYVAIFSPVVYLGTLWVDRFNKLMMTGLIVTFLLFVFSSFGYIDLSLLKRMDWKHGWLAIPTVFTAFGFQNLIPTLVTYMQRDYKKVRIAIWLGTTIPLILYLLWEFLILGIVPINNLTVAMANGQNAVVPLQEYLQKSALGKIGEVFAFFAMTTSFICLAIGFFDFWADGLKWEKKGLKKLGIFSLVFLIPLLIVYTNPGVFLGALNLAGGLGVTVLFGVLPSLYIWAGRYFKGRTLSHQFVKGGKISLVVLLLFSFVIMVMGLI